MSSQALCLKRQLGVVPVTALAFYISRAGSLYLLAGEDNVLNVYETNGDDSALKCSLRIFEAQSIHGFHITPGQQPVPSSSGFYSEDGVVLVWGAQSVAAVPLTVLEDAIGNASMLLDRCVVTETKTPDWIYDGVISPFDAFKAVLVLAHNEILPISLAPDAASVVLGSVFSISRPILYSANLRWMSPTCVLVAGGTVFGEILVWKYYSAADSTSDLPRGELLHVFTGHEGSIFGVQISELFHSGDGNTKPVRFLASCSDDRTIRVWNISDQAAGLVASIPELDRARETGFGDAPTPETKQGELPLSMAMGHLSRIWHVKFPLAPLVSSSEKFVLPVYSFGEDTTVQLWHFESTWDRLLSPTAPTKTDTLKHVTSYANHDGKHLWSTALFDPSPLPKIATGGADGKISIIEQGSPRDGDCSGNHMDVMVLQNDPLSDSQKGGKDSDGLRQYTFITDDCLVATTKSGKFITGSFGSETAWTEVEASEDTKADLRTCTTVTRLGAGRAILGTSRGQVYVYSLAKGLQKLSSLSGKIMQLIALDSDNHAPVSRVLVTVFNSPETRIIGIDFDSGCIVSEHVLQGVDERFIVTSAAFVGVFLVIGSRKGFLAVLSTADNQFNFLTEIPPRAHDAVTCITALPGHSSAQSPCFLTTGRDGKYRIYQINAETAVASLYHEVELPFGPVVETAWFSSKTSELIICGFRSTRLIVWNETKREQIASVECGGAHRVFAHTASSEPNTLRVAFTKASRVYVHSQTKPAFWTLKKGIHGREIRTVAPCGRFFASGSEDTTIRIWEHSASPVPGRGSLACAAQLRTHVSGLQSLKWAAKEWLFSSSGNEEFFVWRVRQLDETTVTGLAAMFQGQLPNKSRDGDLRIMDFDIQAVSDENLDEPEFRIHMAFSNSELKTYAYSPTSGFKLLASGEFTGACLLQIRELTGPRPRSVLSPVLTASTDGHLCLWEVSPDNTQQYKLSLATTAHQNSPKGFDVRYFRTAFSHGYLAVTGGDDNAVGIVRYIAAAAAGEPAAYRVTGKYVIRSAHAAAINGLAIGAGDAADDVCIALTASNDQRVKMWRISGIQSGNVGVELLDDQYSGVSDAGSVEELDEGRGFVVSGVGMEIWSVQARQ